MVGVVVSVLGIVGLVASLFISARATSLAGRATKLAANATRQAGRAAEASARGNLIAESGFEQALREFNEHMRPRSCIVGMTLLDRWQEHANKGNPLPLRIRVQNMGGGT